MAAPSGGIVQKLTGNPVGEAAAFAGGLAIHPVLRPILQELTNLTWSEFRSLPVDAVRVAEGVAHGHIDAKAGAAEASLSGVSTDRFDKLVLLAKVGPGVSSAFELWRRGKINDGGFELALTRAGIEQQWIDALKEIKERVLEPAVIAVAIQRGVMTAPFSLPYNANVPEGTIKPFPVSTLDTAAEAEASGWTLERLRIETALVGLPMALDRAARAEFRGIINHDDFLRAVLEGNARGEWADAELEVARQILSAHDYVEARLRAWLKTDEEMYAGTALHGMSEADTDLLFKVTGRPIAPHRVFIGERRGGHYGGPTTDIDPAFLKAQQESNERPEWYNLDWATRFTKPTLFFVRTWLKDGHPHDQAQTWLWELGYDQGDIDKIILAYGGAPKSPAATTQKSANAAAVRSIARAYIAGNTTQATAQSELDKLGEDPASYPALFVAWDVNRQATLQALSNAQVRTRFRNLGLTETEALAILESRGLDPAAATAYLTAPVRPPAT